MNAQPDRVEERRSEPRHVARLIVHFLAHGRATEPLRTARTGDLSTTGMFIATRRPPPRRTRLSLDAFLDVSDEPPVRVEAVVRWRRRFLEPRGMGVEIVAASEADRRRLEGWLRRAGGPQGEGTQRWAS